jgi:hypothetical protein
MASANAGDGARPATVKIASVIASIRFHMKGRSRAWTAPHPSPSGGEPHAITYMKTREWCGSAASASRIAGMRNSVSVTNRWSASSWAR